MNSLVKGNFQLNAASIEPFMYHKVQFLRDFLLSNEVADASGLSQVLRVEALSASSG